MRWKLSPSAYVKTVAASLSAFTLVMSPVAQGAEAANQRQMVNEYLKTTGLTTKQMTVGEYWKMVRHVYPEKLQSQLDQFVQIYRNELMPKIEATSFKDKNNVEQVRLTLSTKDENATITFTGNEEAPLKYNGVTFKRSELKDYKNFNAVMEKVMKEDPQAKKSLSLGEHPYPIGKHTVLTINEFEKLTVRQQANYLLKARYAAEAAHRVYQAHYGLHVRTEMTTKEQWAFNLLFGQEAEAANPKAGDNCIVAGYFTVYGENGSCGGVSSGAFNLNNQMQKSFSTCGTDSVSCNPLVYGYDSSGKTFCVSRAKSEIIRATAICNGKSPLRKGDPLQEAEDAKRIVESYINRVSGKNINLKLNAEGKISPEQRAEIAGYLSGLQGYIASASQKCGQEPLASIQQTRIDQGEACQELVNRATDLMTFMNDPGDDCSSKIPGSVKGANGQCKCAEGSRMETKRENGQVVRMCVAAGGDGSCGFWCRNKRMLAVIGIGLLGLGLFWYLTKDKSKVKKPVYVPPEPGTTTTPTTKPTTPGGGIDDPGTAPCPAPNYLIGKVCTPPVVVPPTDSEGGTMTPGDIIGGGVR